MTEVSHNLNMASRSSASVSFEPEKVIQPIYTGGDISVDARGRVLATCLGEEALLTDPNTGEALCRIEGVRSLCRSHSHITKHKIRMERSSHRSSVCFNRLVLSLLLSKTSHTICVSFGDMLSLPGYENLPPGTIREHK